MLTGRVRSEKFGDGRSATASRFVAAGGADAVVVVRGAGETETSPWGGGVAVLHPVRASATAAKRKRSLETGKCIFGGVYQKRDGA